MVVFYVVRHGETLFNQLHRIQGWCDSPLTPKGIAQAKAVQEVLSDIPFVKAYCSTSERAIDTAAYIVEGRNLPLIPRKDLKELNFGILEGEKEEIVHAIGMMKRVQQGFLEQGGETLAMLEKRIVNAFHEIAQEVKTGNVLLVAHGGFIITLLEHITPQGMDMVDRGGVANGNVSVIEWDNASMRLRAKCYQKGA